MNMLKKLTVLTLALALCAALAAGCGSTADKATEAAQTDASAQAQQEQETQETQEGEEAQESEGAGEPEESQPAEAEAALDEAALTEALDLVANVGPGASGSALRAAKAGGTLALFAAENWSEENAQAIADATAAWFDTLDETGKEDFALAWSMVADQAQTIADDPAGAETLSLLSDAGLDADFSALDLSHVGDLLQTIWDSVGKVMDKQ